MAVNQIYTHRDHNAQEIRNFSVEKLAADPSGLGLYEGRLWQNTTDARYKAYIGGAIRVLAYKSDLETFGALVGTHDASGGSLPTVGSGDAGVIRQGDYWIISVAGTLAGISGETVVAPGDMLFSSTDAPALASDWYAVQTNLDLPANLLQYEIVALASLPANTPTAIPTTFTTVAGVQVFNSGGVDITAGLQVTSGDTLESNIALTNLSIRVVGQ